MEKKWKVITGNSNLYKNKLHVIYLTKEIDVKKTKKILIDLNMLVLCRVR